MPGDPYELNLTLTDDETPEFSVEWTIEDGSNFPWSDYAVTYSVHRDGCGLWTWDYGLFDSGGTQNLSQGAGIVVDPTQNLITFTLPAAVRPGVYAHGCRITHTATGKRIQVFDGTLTVAEGNFR